MLAWFLVALLGMSAVAARGAVPAPGPTLVPLRIGVLEFGTVRWELDTMQRLGLARKHGLHLQIVPLASKNALSVALLGGSVDLIVSDWFWVARLRTEGRDYQFVPYSNTVGAVMVAPDAGITSLADLKGRKVGIAGGAVDKSWLIAQAYARKTLGLDLEAAAVPQFAAPPLINRLMLDGRLTAAINYWQYNARLLGHGMQRLISVEEMLKSLGVDTVPPLLGWVFSEHWAASHGAALRAFVAASRDAKQVLAGSDAAWEPLRDVVKPENDAVFAAIRAGYREGIVRQFGPPQIEAARKLFKVIARESHGKLTGGAGTLPPGVFRDGFRVP